jgi:hypothetical protein
MNFDETYQLVELLESDSERETYSARERSTNSEVFVHLLSKDSDRVPSLLTIAQGHLASPATASDLQLKIGTFQNEDCLITKAAVELRSVRQALEQASAKDAFNKASMWRVASVVESAPDTSPQKPQSGEFTRMFSTQEPKPAASAGEFTRMFQAPASEPSPLTATTEQNPATTEPVLDGRMPPAEPGEFTRMFQTQPPRPPMETKPVPPVAPSPQQQSGEFTRMFNSVRAPEPATKETWLDFTEKPKQNNSLDTINWDSPQPQGATGAFAVPAALPSQPPVEQGPSEFTRMMSAVSTPPKQDPASPASPQAEQSASAQTKSPAQTTSNLPLIIGVNVVLITIVALILYFVLKR